MDCHPDKNPDNPKAAELFHELSSALELLSDEKARSTYDKYQQAKKAAALRNDQLDIKRRKLKNDLEARERNIGVKVESSTKSASFANVEEQMKAEIDRLRKEGSRLVEEEQRLMREQIYRANATVASESNGKATPTRLKIKWKAEKGDSTNGGYTSLDLRRYLGKYGDITELVILPGKKGSALVEFSTRDAAEMAVAYEKGDLKNPLKLSWLAGQEPPKSQTANVAQSDTSTVNQNDFESLVLRNLRQAEERKRLIEQMEREDAS